MIYAIEAWGTGFIKFGKSKSIKQRLRELEVGSPFELHIRALAEWPDEAESAIHLFLQADIERGEWYQEGVLTEQVLGWMGSSDYGLERLRLATGRKQIQKEGASKPLAIARTRKTWLPPAERIDAAARRRSERKAWWDAQESVASAQQSHCTMPIKAVS